MMAPARCVGRGVVCGLYVALAVGVQPRGSKAAGVDAAGSGSSVGASASVAAFVGQTSENATDQTTDQATDQATERTTDQTIDNAAAKKPSAPKPQTTAEEAQTYRNRAEINPDKASVRFILDPRRPLYDINVAFEYATTIWAPVPCTSVTNGNPSFFGVEFARDDATNRRYTLTPKVSKGNATTNLAFACEQGVAFVLRARQGPAREAAITVEFAFDEPQDARLQAALREERARVAESLEKERKAMRVAATQAAERDWLQAMLRRFSAGDDVEYGRKDFLLAKVFREVLVGGRGSILFQIKNHTKSDVSIQGVDVIEEEGGRVLGATMLAMTDRRVAAGDSVLAAVSFEAPADPKPVRLVIREDGPRVVEVKDIDF